MNFVHFGFRFWTNAFFFIPLAFAITTGFYLYALLLSASIILSLLYHASGERKLKHVDIAVAWTLMGYNAFLLFSSDLLPYWASCMVLIFAVAAIYVFTHQTRQNYAIQHGFYHILASGICLFCLVVSI